MILPTLSEFEVLPLATREDLFVAWIKDQPPGQSYTYIDIKVCPLAQFGTLIQRGGDARGGACSFITSKENGSRHVRVLEEYGKTANRLFTHNTFGDLAAFLS